MALLVKKLSFLPFLGMSASRSFVASYASTTSPGRRRNSINQTVNDDDGTTTDEDDVVSVDQETVVAVPDDEIDAFQPVVCRVSIPPGRRPWATSQDETALRLRMDMPGVAKDDVKVYLDDMKLVVKGKYPRLIEEASDDGNVLADNVGVYAAEIALPDNVKTQEIKSELKDGMLLVTAPKEVTLIPVQ